MAQLNQLILTAANYKVLLIVDRVTYPILTGETVSWNIAREQETIYAIGDEEPIGEKRNAAKYSGKLSLQNGEMAAILQVSGYTEATQLVGCTLAIASTNGLFSHVFGLVNINTAGVDLKAKDKQSIISLDWNALTLK
jgi:hypothetical protein